MAGTIKGITVEIGGDTTQLQRALSEVNSKTRDINAELSQVSKLLKLDPGNTTLLAQKQQLLSEAIGTSSSKLETLKSVQEQVNKQFQSGDIGESQYRAFERQIESTEISLKKYSDQQSELASGASSAGNEVKDLGNSFDDAGGKALSFGDVLKANVIGQAIVDGVKALGGALKGLASDALDNADSIQQMADQTGLSSEKIQELSYVGDTLGVSIDTITGSFSKLINNMSSASAGSGTAYEAFSKLGVSVTDSNGNLRDSNNVFNDVINALGNVSDMTTRTAISQDIFGKSAADLNPLIGAGADQLSQLAQQAEKTGAVMSNGTVSALDDFGDTLGQLKTSVTSMAGTLLQKLIPAIQPVIEKVRSIDVTPVADFLAFIINNSGTIVAGLAAIGAGFAAFQVAEMIQGAVTAFQAFKTAQEGATVAQWAMNTAMSANPIGILVAAIAALVAGIIVLWNTNDGFKSAILSAWEVLKTGVGSAVNAIAVFFTQTIPNALSFMVNWFASLPGKIGNAIASAISVLGTWAANLISTAKSTLPEVISTVIGFFASLPGKMLEIGANIITGLWSGMSSMISWIWDKITAFCDSIVSKMQSVLEIGSPSRVMADEVGQWIPAGIAAGISNNASVVTDAMGALDLKLGNLAVAGSVPNSYSNYYNAYSTSNGGDTINLKIGDIHVHEVEHGCQLAEDIIRNFPSAVLQARYKRR